MKTLDTSYEIQQGVEVQDTGAQILYTREHVARSVDILIGEVTFEGMQGANRMSPLVLAQYLASNRRANDAMSSYNSKAA